MANSKVFFALCLFLSVPRITIGDNAPQKMVGPLTPSKLILAIVRSRSGERSEERFTVTPQGQTTLYTEGTLPFEKNQGNGIGTYEAKLTHTSYDKLLKMIERAIEQHKGIPLPPNSSYLEGALEGGSPLRWRLPSEIPSVEQVVASLEDISLNVKEHPKQVLTMSCKTESKTLKCTYQNIGTETLRTLSPIDVPDALLCFEKLGEVKHLGRIPPDSDPKKVFPKIIFRSKKSVPQNHLNRIPQIVFLYYSLGGLP